MLTSPRRAALVAVLAIAPSLTLTSPVTAVLPDHVSPRLASSPAAAPDLKEGQHDIDPDPPLPPRAGGGGRMEIRGLPTEELVTGLAAHTDLKVRVLRKGQPVAGRQLRVAWLDYQGEERGFVDRNVTSAVTNKRGTAHLDVQSPISTYRFSVPFSVDVLTADGASSVAYDTFQVKVDPDLPESDPSATCPPGSATAPAPVAPERASFRALYLVACDVPGFDQRKALGFSLDAAIETFRDLTADGRVPRFVRDATGAIDVGLVTLPFTRAQLADVRTYKPIYTWLAANLPDEEDVHYLTYYDGRADDLCGESRGGAGMGILIVPQRSCLLYPDEVDGGGYDVYVTVHEMTHAFGAVPDCAPHSEGSGHVDDDPNDVLYFGDEDGTGPLVLDAAHDDYYLTGKSSCEDINDSPLWMTASEG